MFCRVLSPPIVPQIIIIATLQATERDKTVFLIDYYERQNIHLSGLLDRYESGSQIQHPTRGRRTSMGHTSRETRAHHALASETRRLPATKPLLLHPGFPIMRHVLPPRTHQLPGACPSGRQNYRLGMLSREVGILRVERGRDAWNGYTLSGPYSHPQPRNRREDQQPCRLGASQGAVYAGGLRLLHKGECREVPPQDPRRSEKSG